ncbi:MAG: hypothetical protein K9M57_01825 [Phycisphaerae bacterium]|nr:hypothetical protein [Phycisphaerae bacterium]
MNTKRIISLVILTSMSTCQSCKSLQPNNNPFPTDAKEIGRHFFNLNQACSLVIIDAFPAKLNTSKYSPMGLMEKLKTRNQSYPKEQEFQEYVKNYKKEQEQQLIETKKTIKDMEIFQKYVIGFGEIKQAIKTYSESPSEDNLTNIKEPLYKVIVNLEQFSKTSTWKRKVPKSRSKITMLALNDARKAFGLPYGNPYPYDYIKSSSRLSKLNSNEACQHFFNRSTALGKDEKKLLDTETKRIQKTWNFKLKNEDEFFRFQKQWSTLCEDISLYYISFHPQSYVATFNESSANMLASINEAICISKYLYLTYESSEHISIYAELIDLKEQFLANIKNTKTNNSELVRSDPLSIDENRVKNYLTIFYMYRELEQVLEKVNALDLKTIGDEEITDLIDEAYYIRLGGIKISDEEFKKRTITRARLMVCFDMCQIHARYMSFRTKDKRWEIFSSALSNISKNIQNANDKLSKDFLNIQKADE